MIAQNYRTKFGKLSKTCMACAAQLGTDREIQFGLCLAHQQHIIRPPHRIKRNFGRGTEYQLLGHTDELDDIIYKLEYDKEPLAGRFFGEGEPNEPGPGRLPRKNQYLIYVHYIAKLFLTVLCGQVDLSSFDYITCSTACSDMELIAAEMGYLFPEKQISALFLLDELRSRKEEPLIPTSRGKRILLLDLYRSMETRNLIDRLKISGASEVVTVYLTSYS